MTRPRPVRRTVAAAFAAAGAVAVGVLPGCAATGLVGTAAQIDTAGEEFAAGVGRAGRALLDSDERAYLGDAGPAATLTSATKIDEPAWDRPPAPEAVSDEPPRVNTLGAGGNDRGRRVWDLSLDEAIKLTLERTRVVRDREQFASDNNPLLSAPLAIVSVFDPAIQETGVGFNRGVEAALADFDAEFTTSYIATRDERIQNNPFVVGRNAGDTLVTEDGRFQSSLSKNFATGGQAVFTSEIERNFSNVGAQLFPSAFNTGLSAQFRQPLLAGAGSRFNRIAGPNARNNRFLGNLDQGVLIARINNDQSIADFEREVRNLLRDVERAYWDLAAVYRAYDAEATAKAALLEIYRNVRVRSEEQLTGGGAGDLALALDQYRDAEFRTRDARAQLLTAELGLRRLMNLPVSDGRIIRPSEEPVTAQFDPDWRASLSGALVNRVELRRQKWEVTRLSLQLEAAHNAARPQLDLVSGYRVNGFGDQLIGDSDSVPGAGDVGDSSFDRLTDGDQTGWTLGFEFTLPVGLRAAKTQIRNLELRIAKAKATLDTQEHEISHELAAAFQELSRQYGQATTALARRQAAADRVAAFDALRDTAQGDLDLLLRSEVSLAQAETQYWRAVYAYNQAIADVFHRQGTLLERDGVFLAEGDWRPDAYRDATREAWARANAIPAPLLDADPEPFARPERPPVPLPIAGPFADGVPPAPTPAPTPAPAPLPTANGFGPIEPAPAPLPIEDDGDLPELSPAPTDPADPAEDGGGPPALELDGDDASPSRGKTGRAELPTL